MHVLVQVCSFATTFASFLPTRILKRLFPRYIAGLTVFLVGVYLCGVEITNWGGALLPLNCLDMQSFAVHRLRLALPFGTDQSANDLGSCVKASRDLGNTLLRNSCGLSGPADF